MALRGRRINYFVGLWCPMASEGVEITVSLTNFQKSNISWLQQPHKEKVPDISKKWIFDDPFHRKGPVLIILVPGMIPPSR